MKDKLYFNNLNGLRFIAAFMVIVSHMELNKSYFDLQNNFQYIKELGRLGVSLFFVLSGFLITFLLLKEKEKNNFINIKNFYLRRIYRIWPLYYLIVLLSLFVLPNIELFHIPNLKLEVESSSQFFIIILLFVCFLSNVLIHLKLIPFSTQTWSIGTEEQFYLFWPVLIDRCQNFKIIFIALIIFYNLVLITLGFSFFDNIKYVNLIKNFVYSFQLDSLTIGSLGAFFLYVKNYIIRFLTNLNVFFFTIAIIVLSITYDFQFGIFKSTYFATLFILVIINLVNHPKLINLLENRVFNYLGKISYGLYMYHQIVMVFVINFILKNFEFNNVMIYLFSILITILISSISYKFFESPFLKRKDKISTFHNHKATIYNVQQNESIYRNSRPENRT
jgi:peptidoglycan/LPS O-acetylase OafA/YrhL